MPDEPCNDHERKEDVESQRKRVIWNSGVGGEGVLDATRLRGLVNEYDTERCINRISRKVAENSGTYHKWQGTPGLERR